MDDSCAVCADNLEWVAYGACGHREVCSTCVARLRFICNDRRCCICKTESSVIFVTKALGDYTRMINDFSVLPYEVREGRVGSYWYHEDTQAFFDDIDHYKMIKAMCKLSCSLCDKMAEPSNDWVKRRGKFRSIEQLKGHFFYQHRLLMCGLCLDGRKVFICEQKLYTKAQLRQHISTGDSEADGTEGERCGFTGHPLCEFCKTPFYGDSELYSHMSTQHYTCHICQRQRSGQYEYYKNYDDLEIHFDTHHYLCEDEGCLAKKFVVFPSEAELKRHSIMEHRGRMSRAQRNAALQIPTSFQYRRCNEDNHHVRGRIFRREQSDNDHQPSAAIEASLGTSSGPPVSSAAHAACDHGNLRDIDPLVLPFESLSTSDSETSSRYSQALGRSSSAALLRESSFPPLPVGSSTNQHKSKHCSEGLANNTMFANLGRQKNRNLNGLSSAQEWPAAIRRPMQASSSSSQVRLTTNVAAVTSWNTGNGAAQSSNASSKQSQPHSRTARADVVSSGSQMSSSNTSRISHSSSVPNLADSRFSQPSVSDFPPVSLAQRQKHSYCSQVQANVEDVHTTNKSLVEKVRSALEYDEVKYSAFKDISAQYRLGSVGAARYLDYVRWYGLSHLVLELARLCPDVQKQKELIEVYNASFQSNGLQQDGSVKGGILAKENNTSKKGKEKLKTLDAESRGGILAKENNTSKKGKEKLKALDTECSDATDSFANSVISSVRKMQSSYNPSEEEVEVLSKEGYCPSKSKSKVVVEGPKMEQCSSNQPSIKIGSQNGSTVGTGDGGGGNKRRKKTSKFHRVRLGDGSIAALLDLKNSDPDPDPLIDKSDSSQNSTGGLPVRGVWKKGGSQKLFS